ncbi:benzoate-CoA ligase family protein [Haliea sp.]
MSLRGSYNAASDLIQRNLDAGRADKIAFIDDRGSYTYAELDQMSSAFANVLVARGLQMEQRILLCLHDSIHFPVAFLGAIKAGIVPVAVNTLLTVKDYRYMLQDSRVRLAVVSAPLLPTMQQAGESSPFLDYFIVSGEESPGDHDMDTLLASASNEFEVASTTADDMCFWLYSSGSTGSPKGTVHKHSSLLLTAENYAIPILDIGEDDLVFSAAKLFFAYGLGNALTFPLAVGATSLLMTDRPTPESVSERLLKYQPTIFFGVPTLYAAMLASTDLPLPSKVNLRCCVSAGEALPEEIGRQWSNRFGIDLLDGIGSTEMLHIFLSNRPGSVRYGTTGRPVPGYELRIVNEEGASVSSGEIGELQIKGSTGALFYWNSREKSVHTFQGHWVRSGDKYWQDEEGYFIYAGRSDDMLKVGGIYVSPIEIEGVLMEHAAVLEAAVIGREDAGALIKPVAYIVLKPGLDGSDALAAELKSHVKSRLAPYKYPRWIEFMDELPKTATGKIQRFKLRALG